ncbi:MAG: NADH:ubiquinone reductase (Na(+)-transporting) subunit C [Rikenellaceae bacterium]
MNKQSNSYTIIYSIILVVVVAVTLAYVSVALKPIQQQNIEIEKMSDILGSVGLYNPADAPKDKDNFIKEQYATYIKEGFLVNSKGEESGNPQSAFKVLTNLKAVYSMPENERELPVFISTDKSGKVNYIFPIYGTGLWGPIWGYVALEDDLNTISGVVFDHSGETPGLGAEITSSAFEGQYVNKKIFNGGQFVGVKVSKGAGSSKGNDHAVDAVSGGTITSRGVESMIIDCLGSYVPFIQKRQK